MKTFIIGGSGFIGSVLIRLLIAERDCRVGNVDQLTCAGNLGSRASAADSPRYRNTRADLCARAALVALFAEHQPAGIIHLIAKSYVARSIQVLGDLVQTSITSAYTLLESTRRFWSGLADATKARLRAPQVFIDEVYGEIWDTRLFTECI